MSVLDRLRQQAQRTAKSVLRLPVVSERVIQDPKLERLAAEQDLVPRRCGLCKFFSRAEYEQTVALNPSFREAARHLAPEHMGVGSARRIDPATLALRPTLQDRWEDYGGCLKHHIFIWGFEVAPAMPSTDDPPCGEWL